MTNYPPPLAEPASAASPRRRNAGSHRWRRVHVLALLFAWFAATGAQWEALQIFAWARMTVNNYAASSSLAAAVQQTFAPGSSCRLCCAVRKAKQSEQKQDGALPAETGTSAKVFLFLESGQPALVPLPAEATAPGQTRSLASLGRDRPPLPPPKSAVTPCIAADARSLAAALPPETDPVSTYQAYPIARYASVHASTVIAHIMHAFIQGQIQKKQVQAALLSSRVSRSHFFPAKPRKSKDAAQPAPLVARIPDAKPTSP